MTTAWPSNINMLNKGRDVILDYKVVSLGSEKVIMELIGSVLDSYSTYPFADVQLAFVGLGTKVTVCPVMRERNVLVSTDNKNLPSAIESARSLGFSHFFFTAQRDGTFGLVRDPETLALLLGDS